MFLFFVLYHFNALWKFLWLGNSVWDFLGFWFLPHSIIPVMEIRNTPWVVLLTPLKDQNMLLKMILGSKGWHSGESACIASHQCDPGLNPGINAFCGLSLFVLSFAPKGFSPGTPVFPSPQKPIFQIHIWLGISRPRTTLWKCYSKSLFMYFLSNIYSVFINLCVSNLLISLSRSLQCVPDVWSLGEWSNWLTPVHLPRRYDTMFYTCFLDKEPPVLVDEKEMTHSEVCS